MPALRTGWIVHRCITMDVLNGIPLVLACIGGHVANVLKARELWSHQQPPDAVPYRHCDADVSEYNEEGDEDAQEEDA